MEEMKVGQLKPPKIWKVAVLSMLLVLAVLLHPRVLSPLLAPFITDSMESGTGAAIELSGFRFNIFKGAYIRRLTLQIPAGPSRKKTESRPSAASSRHDGQVDPSTTLQFNGILLEHQFTGLLSGHYRPDRIAVHALSGVIRSRGTKTVPVPEEIQALIGTLPAIEISKVALQVTHPRWPAPVTIQNAAIRLVPGRLQRRYGGSVSAGTPAQAQSINFAVNADTIHCSEALLCRLSGQCPGEKHATIALNDFTARGRFAATGEVTVTAFAGRYHGGDISGKGRFQLKDGSMEQPAMTIRLKDIPLKAAQKAISPEIASMLKALGITDGTGSMHLDLDNRRERYAVRIRSKTARPPRLPGIRLHDPFLHFEWRSDRPRIRFKRIEAGIDSGTLQGRGELTWNPDTGEEERLRFTLQGSGIPLTARYFESIVPAETLGDRQVSGFLDFTLHADQWEPTDQFTNTALEKIHGTATLTDIAVREENRKPLLHSGYARLTLGEQGWELYPFRCVFQAFEMDGRVFLPVAAGGRDGGRIRFSVDVTLPAPARNIPHDRHGLPEKLRTAHAKMFGTLQVPKNKAPLNVRVSSVLHNLEMSHDGRPIRADGATDFEIGLDADGITELDGRTDLNHLSIGKVAIRQLTARVAYADNDILTLPQFKADIFGGTITGSRKRLNAQTDAWRSDLKLMNIRFDHLTALFGIQEKDSPSGTLHADIVLFGSGRNAKPTDGRIEFAIERGHLYSMPMFSSIFNILNLKMPGKSQLTNAFGTLVIEEEQIVVKEIIFGGGAVPVLMEGTVGFSPDLPMEKQPVDLLVTVGDQQGLLDHIPVINWIEDNTLNLLQSLVFQTKLTGTVTDFEVKTIGSPITRSSRRMWELIKNITGGRLKEDKN